MKINPTDYLALKTALMPFLVNPTTERQRWDALWHSGFDVGRLYKAGLDDSHIDTALRAVVKELVR